MRTELVAIKNRLEQLIGKNSHEVLHLNIRLNCRNCRNSTNIKGVWNCKLYGDIPEQYISEGCDSWVNNITIK